MSENNSTLERKIESEIEKKVGKKLEKKIEKEAEKKIEKDLEKKVEKKIEKEVKKISKIQEKAEIISEEKSTLQKSSISIHIDKYSFIFSDFDPRPFSQRMLSEDFLREAKRFALETKHGMLELRFLVPEIQRNTQIEAIIKKRLREHFKNQYLKTKREKHEIIRNGVIIAAIGFAALAGATLIAHSKETSLFETALIVMLEPIGWFSFWYALDSMFYSMKEKKPEIEFNEKMSKADIIFENY